MNSAIRLAPNCEGDFFHFSWFGLVIYFLNLNSLNLALENLSHLIT
ncbi:hypothetical protein ZORO111902_07730 [Zobellia roscoffensis]